MTERFMTAAPETTQVLPARLEPDAIGAAQDTIIGMANSAPTVAIGLSLAGLAAAAAYGSGPVIILCGIPMLVIANAYRRLNLWSANCGASFEWVGRATYTPPATDGPAPPGAGARIEMHGATIVEVDNAGLVTSWRDYLDRKEPESQIRAAVKRGG